MEAFTSVIAILLLDFLILSYALWKSRRNSFVEATIFDEICYRDNKVVAGELTKFIYSHDGQYRAKCVIECGNGPQTIEVGVPNGMFAVMDMESESRKVSLLQIDFGDALYYQLIPMPNPNIPVTIAQKKQRQKQTGLAANIFEKRASRVYFCGYILMFVGLMLASTNFPISLVAGFASASIFNWVKPFRKLTGREIGSIIYKKETRKKEDDKQGEKVNPELPVGYKDWTDVEKELYDIEARIGATALMPSREFGTLEHEEDPDTTRNWKFCEPIEDEDFKIESADEGAAMFRACKQCGCIIETDVLTCPSCGVKLSDGSIAYISAQEAPEKEKTPKKNDKKTGKKRPQNKKRDEGIDELLEEVDD